MSQVCPYKLCPMPKRKQHAFCIEHWKQLPLALRQEIVGRWNVYLGAHAPNLRMAAVRAWRESMAKAHAILQQKEDEAKAVVA